MQLRSAPSPEQASPLLTLCCRGESRRPSPPWASSVPNLKPRSSRGARARSGIGGDVTQPQGDAPAVRERRAAACSSLHAYMGRDSTEGPRAREPREAPGHSGSPRRGRAARKSFGSERAQRPGACELQSHGSAVTLSKGRRLPDPGCCELLPGPARLSLLQGMLREPPAPLVTAMRPLRGPRAAQAGTVGAN